ncbi:MAG TPA: thioredoxin [bacterium]|nr:MAG: Thioredoxin-1 [bacterium ADurb.Bin236]HOY61802.1 thioredoxin [bacterium]HPI78688.1 thioredoxin [bacterium]HPN94785.1 thioredoxin [bacterium]
MAAELQSSNFDQEVINSATPVVVDFSAVWCGPCKMLAPTIDKLAQAYEGKAKVFKMDVDNSRDIATKFGIRGVPTVIFFKGGAEKDRVVGLVPYEMLDSKLNGLL